MANNSKKIALEIVKKLTQRGFSAYWAGGCVRDHIMGREAEDYDIATSARPEQIEELFDRSIPVGRQFGVIIVLIDGIQFEVATFRSDQDYQDGRRPTGVKFTTPEEDALRRDFTINGLFFDPVKEQVIDFVGGQKDIKERRIQTIGTPEQRFMEDHLRLLRAIRFSANLDFEIESKTWNSIIKNKALINKVSQERIREELIKLFTRSNPGRGLQMLSDSGLLKEILPEVDALKGVQQPPEFHPEGDVFVHTKMLLNQLQNPDVTLVFGALLHDVGKPSTYSEKDGKIRFYNHSHIGAQIARGALERLRFSKKEIENILSCIENHMKFANVREMRIGKLKQFIARETFETELELHKIDCLASHGMLENYHFLRHKMEEFKAEDLKPKRLIDGYDLQELGMKTGPKMKEVLSDIYTLQLEGTLKTKADAISYVKKTYFVGGS